MSIPIPGGTRCFRDRAAGRCSSSSICGETGARTQTPRGPTHFKCAELSPHCSYFSVYLVVPEGFEPPSDRSKRPILSVGRWNQIKKPSDLIDPRVYAMPLYAGYKHNRISIVLDERLDELDMFIVAFIVFYILILYVLFLAGRQDSNLRPRI